MLSGTYAKFTQNPAMKLHLLSTANKRLAEASPLDPVWGIGLWANDPRATELHQWRGQFFLGEALSTVHEAIRDSEAGSLHPATPRRFLSTTGIHEIIVRSTIALGDRGRSALAKALLRGFRPRFRAHFLPTNVRMFW